MLHGRPSALAAEERAREDDGVERDVVLAEELHQVDFLVVLPPTPPLVGVRGGDGDVADRRVEPHVEHFVLEALERDRRAPLQVACDAALVQVLCPRARDVERVGAPARLGAGLLDVLGQRLGELREVDEQMLGGLDDGALAAELALGVLQVDRVDDVLARVALVAACARRAAVGTRALDETVGEEAVAVLAEELLDGVGADVAVVVELPEDLLRDLGLLLGRGATEAVERDVEPLVNLLVQLVVLLADFLGSGLLGDSLLLGRRSVLVSSADVQCIVAALLAISLKNIFFLLDVT